MVLIYFSELNTTIDAATLATFDPTATTNLTGRTYFTDVDLTCTAANARALMKFTTDGADVTAEDVTGVWTNTAGAITGAGGYSDAASINYVQEMSNLVFGSKAFVDLFDNEAAIDTDYKSKYDICVSQLNYGGGAASSGSTDNTNNAAALAAVKGILTDDTARKRFELQYNMAPNTTFTANAECDVFRYNTGTSSFDTTKLTNFTLDVAMTNATSVATIKRGTIDTDDHTLIATDKFMILNPKTGETLVQTITQDSATILNNLTGTLATPFSALDFGYGVTETVTLNTIDGNGLNGKVTVTCDANGAITNIVGADHDSGQANYAAGRIYNFVKNSKTVTITAITAAMATDLNATNTAGTNNMLSISDARFSTTAMTVTGGNGAAEISLAVAGADGIPTGATISTTGASYVSGGTISLTNVGTAGNNLPVVLTFTNEEVVCQLNGVTLTSDVKEAAATTNGKGVSPHFTTANTLPVTDPTGTAAGGGSGALVNVEMSGNDVTNVSLSTTSNGTGYETTGRMVVHNYTTGTVAMSGGASAVLMNDVQKAMLNKDVNAGVVALTSVPVPFEAADELYARIDITTPTGQTNASAETPTAFTQKSIVKITLT